MTSAAADAALTFDANIPLVLPCGRSVILDPFDGHAQKRLTPNREGRFEAPHAAISDVLARCIKQVNGKKYDAKRMHLEAQRMPNGSRVYAFAMARAYTYGSALDLEWKCAACGADCRHAVELDELPVAHYPDGLLASGFAFTARTRSGSRAIHVKVGTGETVDAFFAAMTKGDCGPLDAALFQVDAIDDKGVKLADLMALPGDALSAIRNVVAMMDPRVFLDDASESAWIAKANAYLRELGNDVPAVDDDAEAPEVLGVPQGGMKTRVQVKCKGCGAASWQSVESAPGFFFQHLQPALDE